MGSSNPEKEAFLAGVMATAVQGAGGTLQHPTTWSAGDAHVLSRGTLQEHLSC